MDETRIVVDCPVCKRTIWANSTCHHGKVPDLDEKPPVVIKPDDAPVKESRQEPPPYKRKRRT